MQRLKQKKLILITVGIFTPLFLTNSNVNASSFGAEIFCTMRDGGNDHESSWEAAYTYIKKQKGGKAPGGVTGIGHQPAIGAAGWEDLVRARCCRNGAPSAPGWLSDAGKVV